MATSIILVKRFTYRGNQNEEWSNRYYLDGDDPTTAAEWMDIFTPLAAAEKILYMPTTKITRAYGYTSDSPNATAQWVKDLKVSGPEIAGTQDAFGGNMPGDVAAIAWWKTSRMTSKGKAIYLRKFFHDGVIKSDDPNLLNTDYAADIQTFCTLLASGAGVDGRHIRGPGQASETIFASGPHPWITTRTLKRRGRRPTPAP